MSFNIVTLVGWIATDLKLRHAKREAHEEPMPVVDFKLTTRRRQGKSEKMSIRVVTFGGAAATFLKFKKKGDHVLVSGRLCQSTFPGKEGGIVEHHYVVAEDFRFFWGPPGKFIKDHVLVPRDQYARFKALEEEAGGPFHVPEHIAEKLGVDQPPSAAELRAITPEDAERVMARVLQDQAEDTLDMPGGISGSTGFERQRTRRPQKKTKRRARQPSSKR